MDGLDATSAQTFGTLWSILIRLGVEMVITELDSPQMQQLLVAHDVIGEASCVYATRTQALFGLTLASCKVAVSGTLRGSMEPSI